MGDLPIRTCVLSNGIRLVHQERVGFNISHCGLVINAGSRDELKSEHGLAHFIEHALFKGTKKRKTFHILNRLDSVGGEINAFTTKEDTSIYASCLTDHTERAMELLGDITFNATFPEKELKKERDVIIDEINSYLDSPSDTLFDEFEAAIFKGQTIGRSILGTRTSVMKLGQEDIFKFRKRRYQSKNIVFSYIGDRSFEKVKGLAEKHFSSFQSTGRTSKRISAHKYSPIEIKKEISTHQAHIMIGAPAYDIMEEKKFPMMMLNNLLGGPAMNSLLNLNVRERFGIAYNIESNYQPYTDTGLFQIYMGTDRSQAEKAISLVHKELTKLRNNKLGARQLHSAKMQIKGYIAMSREGAVSNMLSQGKSMMLYDRVDGIEKALETFDKIDSSMILDVANEILTRDNLSTMIYT